ncbi:MAG: hypothetical protein ACE5KH_04820 [Candidatus Geothermarchaeales archaeon]
MREGKLLTALFVLVLSTLAFALTISPAWAQEPKVVTFATGHGQIGREDTHDDYNALLQDLVALGYDTDEIEGRITTSSLAGVDLLMLGSVFGESFTNAEVSAIKSWFEEGEKAIWVGSDSDFGEGHYIIENSNKVLEAIGSKIRVEPTQVLDSESNAGDRDYRVVASVTNQDDEEIREITQGVEKALYHGPTILAGFVDSEWVDLETTEVEDVFVIQWTSSASNIADQDFAAGVEFEPQAHDLTATGSFAIFAVERFAGPNQNNKIIVTGSTPFGGYEPIYAPEYYETPLDGPELVTQAVVWSLEIESPPAIELTLIIGVIVVIVIIVAVALYMRR